MGYSGRYVLDIQILIRDGDLVHKVRGDWRATQLQLLMDQLVSPMQIFDVTRSGKSLPLSCVFKRMWTSHRSFVMFPRNTWMSQVPLRHLK